MCWSTEWMKVNVTIVYTTGSKNISLGQQTKFHSPKEQGKMKWLESGEGWKQGEMRCLKQLLGSWHLRGSYMVIFSMMNFSRILRSTLYLSSWFYKSVRGSSEKRTSRTKATRVRCGSHPQSHLISSHVRKTEHLRAVLPVISWISEYTGMMGREAGWVVSTLSQCLAS